VLVIIKAEVEEVVDTDHHKVKEDGTMLPLLLNMGRCSTILSLRPALQDG
jgi:hypothetical protein